MELTFDQKVQLWNTVGTWVAGLATTAAVLFSLWAVRRSDKVRLKVYVGIRLLLGGGMPRQEVVLFSVTNVGERPVNITNISWRLGAGDQRRRAIQTFPADSRTNIPTWLQHGQEASFTIPLDDPNRYWLTTMMTFGEGRQHKQWKTLRCFVHTSVGQAIECVPERELLDKLAEVQLQKA